MNRIVALLKYIKMGEAQKDSGQSFSIVVLGAMNPRIHHPLWYRQHDLISEAETSEAMSDAGQVVLLPQIAQFRTGGIYITCQPDRWDIRTGDPELRPRIAQITAIIFDNLLPETPVGLYAFNNEFHLKTTVPQVSRVLASRLATSGFGLTLPTIDSAGLTVTRTGPEGSQVNIRIEPSIRSPDYVFVGANANHPVTSAGKFDIRPLLDQHYNADFETAKSYADAVVNLLNKD